MTLLEVTSTSSRLYASAALGNLSLCLPRSAKYSLTIIMSSSGAHSNVDITAGTSVPEPSPAMTMATPAPPGFWPKTPAPGQGYDQSEGVLEQAGRDLSPQPKNSTLDDPAEAEQDRKVAIGAGLAGAAVGLVLGGPVGAVLGGGLGSLGALEHEGLKHRLQHESATDDAAHEGPVSDNAPAAPDATLQKQMQQSPAQRELAAAGGAGAGAGAGAAAPLSQLLSGGAGAHDLNQEVEIPATTAESSSLNVPAQQESVLDMVSIA